jgi:hypothetical protein
MSTDPHLATLSAGNCPQAAVLAGRQHSATPSRCPCQRSRRRLQLCKLPAAPKTPWVLPDALWQQRHPLVWLRPQSEAAAVSCESICSCCLRRALHGRLLRGLGAAAAAALGSMRRGVRGGG